MAGYGSGRVDVRIIGGLSVYAGILEYPRDFSPGRHPSIGRFVGSLLGALCGGLVVALLSRRRSGEVRGLNSPRSRAPGSLMTLRWREGDSNHRSRSRGRKGFAIGADRHPSSGRASVKHANELFATVN
jgi:hypothetical protein